MEILAIIPARGGSKGIPDKNIKPLSGKPLIAWTIDAAKKSKYITKTIVSTDSREIMSIAKKHGAEVPFLRPKNISQDLSPSLDLIIHALDWFKDNKKYQPQMLILLPPTAPLRQTKDINKGVALMLQKPLTDSVRPVIESPKHPFKTLKLDGKFLKPFFPKRITGFDEPYDMPRQILPPAYIYSGAMQIMWPKTITQQHSLTGKKSKFFLMNSLDSINIDSLIDFKLAELIMQRRLAGKK